MRTSTERILTTHTGSLPRPRDLLELYTERDAGDVGKALGDAVKTVVRQQLDAGLDIVNDGEFGKPVDTTGDADHGHGVWAMYVRERMTGFGRAEAENPRQQHSKDRTTFAGYYGEKAHRRPGQVGRAGDVGQKTSIWACTGPIEYCGEDVVDRDIRNLAVSLDGRDRVDAFLPVVSPGSVPHLIPNRHYNDEDEYRRALADALHEEYMAIARAGFIVQIDDPALVAGWDFWNDDDLEAYRGAALRDVELLNHALRGIPEEQVRYHLCWGSWNGPHCSDLPLADIVDLMLQVRAGAYVVEAANPRHEHEWKLWHEVRLPDEKLLIPGVVTHKTAVLEHPEVVADRIVRYADVVGRERVIAGTDCGVGGRVSSDVAWAKLASLVEGARLASEQLWS